ncbi:hypothetical protein [Vreelandella alkaliphila]|uniref:Uncharacterized protein n=1 Tax=Vreelandella alkaliphila TaxID=272774 RepID=A0ABX4HKG8_9GAMM|nr:hypothetical protein [Halomonas humidisoli]PAU73004.1 hypothetical protein CK497_07785 [Halomonas humidisoli]
MEKDLVKRAHDAFNQGDYKVAKELYKKAAGYYGESLFKVNITLCDKYLRIETGEELESVNTLFDDIEVKKLQNKVHQMQRQLSEKDAIISERFEELAILTRMLEEKDNAISI